MWQKKPVNICPHPSSTARLVAVPCGNYPLWLWPNLLGLDAPLIAVLWQGFIAACFHITLSWPARVTLALSVWAVYIAVRLLDSTREPMSCEHRTMMTVLLVLALGSATGVSLFHIRPALFWAGILIVALVIFYLAAVHRRPSWTISKEALVAILFTCGTMLAPWIRSDSRGGLLLASTTLFFVCWANTSLIEMMEWRRLRASQGQPPQAYTIAIVEHYRLCSLLFVAFVILLSVMKPEPELRWFLLAPLASASALYLLAAAEERFSPAASRVLADAALLSPLVIWPMLPQ
jgi:hypothetical protein